MTVRLDSKYSVQTNTCEFRKAVNLAYGQGGLKSEINIPPQHILAKIKGGLIIEGDVSSSEYGIKVAIDSPFYFRALSTNYNWGKTTGTGLVRNLFSCTTY